MKRILLVGISGVFNYGCEAIVRGTTAIIKQSFPNAIIYYASYSESDKDRLSDLDITILERKRYGKWSFRNLIRKALGFFNVKTNLPFDTSSKWPVDFDAVFSIGGDMYTLSPSGKYNPSLAKLMEQFKAKGCKYILWGASVGKFEKNKEALDFYKGHLNKTDAIFCREPNTFDYLKQIGINQPVIMAPDPAFFVDSDFKHVYENKTSRLIGLNLSPLSALNQYGDIELAQIQQAKSIIRLIEEMDVDILLIPHVLSMRINDNDLIYLRRIYEMIDDVPHKDRIRILTSDKGFIGIKEDLSRCDFVIASRMHCAINAITVGVPTLFLSYSEKAKGMSEFVYGDRNAVITLKDFEDTSKVSEILNNYHFKSQLRKIKEFNFKNCMKGLI